MNTKLFIVAVLLAGGTLLEGIEPLVIFNPETQTKNFSIPQKYIKLIRKTTDTETRPKGLKSSMLIETLAQDMLKQYWYVHNSCPWHKKTDDAVLLKMQPIEIEFFICPADAFNLPGSESGYKYMNKQSVLRFCFGSSERNQSVKIGLRRSFFQKADGEKRTWRSARTGRWLILSIDRDKEGFPSGLKVWIDGRQTLVPETEYYIDNKNKPDWKHSNFIAIESWGEATDNFQFNIGRITIGKMN